MGSRFRGKARAASPQASWEDTSEGYSKEERELLDAYELDDSGFIKRNNPPQEEVNYQDRKLQAIADDLVIEGSSQPLDPARYPYHEVGQNYRKEVKPASIIQDRQSPTSPKAASPEKAIKPEVPRVIRLQAEPEKPVFDEAADTSAITRPASFEQIKGQNLPPKLSGKAMSINPGLPKEK
ncbi:MAG: hypothetical protein R2865_04825 [Deinococcales bacterium]